MSRSTSGRASQRVNRRYPQTTAKAAAVKPSSHEADGSSLPTHSSDPAQPRPNPEEDEMNHTSRLTRRPGRAWSSTAHTAAALAVAAVLALLTAACDGGSPSSVAAGSSPHPTGSSSSPSAVAYSACMRSHGVPGFPDPGSGGGIPKGDAQHFGVSTAQLQTAQQVCQSLLPTGGSLQDQAAQCASTGDCPPALVQQMEKGMLTFAQCMRSHGFPKFPDPTTDAQGHPVLSWSVSQTGADPHSSQYQTVEAECQSQGGLPGPRHVSP